MAVKRIINNKPKVGDISQYNFNNDETTFDYTTTTGLPKNNDKFQNKDLFTNCVGDEINEAIIEKNLKFEGDPFIKIENLYISNTGADGTVKNNDVIGWIFSQSAYGGDPTKDGYSTVKSKMKDEWRFFYVGFGHKDQGTDIGNISDVEGKSIVSNFSKDSTNIQLGDFPGRLLNFNGLEGDEQNNNTPAGLNAFKLNSTELLDDGSNNLSTLIFNESQYNPIYIVIYTRGDKKVAWPINTDDRKRKYSIYKISSDDLFEFVEPNYVGKVYQVNFDSPTSTKTGEGGGGAQSAAWRVSSLRLTINTSVGVKNLFSGASDYAEFIPTVLPKTKINENSFDDVEWLAAINPSCQLDNNQSPGISDTLTRHPDFIPFTSFGFSQDGKLATSFVDLQSYNYDFDLVMKSSSPLNVTFNVEIKDSQGQQINLASTTEILYDTTINFFSDVDVAQSLGYDDETDPNFLATLPFPEYFEQFNVVQGQGQTPIIDSVDASRWNNFYRRPDVSSLILYLIGDIAELPTQYTYPDYVNTIYGVNDIPAGIVIQESNLTYYYFVIDWNDTEDNFKTIEDYLDSKPENTFDYLQRRNENLYKIYSTKDLDTPNNVYTTPGIKNIKYIMFSVFDGDGTDDSPDFEVGRWKLCTSRIYLDIPPNQYPDFSNVGGSDYTTLPWPFTTVIIGGVSEDSKYKKSVQNTLAGGKIGEFDIIDEKFLLDDLENDELGKNIETMDLEQIRYFNTGSYDINTLLNIPIDGNYYVAPYTDVSGSSTQTSGYWDGETNSFSEESSVGQIFISDNQDNDLKQNCKLELNTGNLTGKSILDSSGNSNKGLLIGDYKVKKIKKGQFMRRDSFIKVPKKTGNKTGAL